MMLEVTHEVGDQLVSIHAASSVRRVTGRFPIVMSGGPCVRRRLLGDGWL
jgi:hypothetical protein